MRLANSTFLSHLKKTKQNNGTLRATLRVAFKFYQTNWFSNFFTERRIINLKCFCPNKNHDIDGSKQLIDGF